MNSKPPIGTLPLNKPDYKLQRMHMALTMCLLGREELVKKEPTEDVLEELQEVTLVMKNLCVKLIENSKLYNSLDRC